MSLARIAGIGSFATTSTVATDRLIPGIHALRGLAALAVVLFHFAHLTSITVPVPLQFVAADFGMGVYLFFVLSAFSLMHSTERHIGRSAWVTVFATKRFWRIAPLFYVVLGMMVIWQIASRQAIDPWRVVLNLTFLLAFSPQDGMVHAGWTVGVEVMFYALFPVLLLTVRSMRAAIVLCILTTIATCAGRIVLFRSNGDWANFMLPSNLCFFSFGLLAYRIVRSDCDPSRLLQRLAPSLSFVALIGLLILPSENPLRHGAGLGTILWGVAFIPICVWRGGTSKHRGNRLMHYIGERSYSIYLLHPLVLWLFRPGLHPFHSTLLPHLGEMGAWFACAALVLVVLLALSEVTYRFVELPGIRIGTWINAHHAIQRNIGTP